MNARRYLSVAVLATMIGAASFPVARAADLRGPFPIERLVGPPSALHGLERDIDCPETPPPLAGLDVESRYDPDDPERARIDPARAKAYRERIKPMQEFLAAVVAAANNSIEKPLARNAWADCAAGLLDGWAAADALSRTKTNAGKLLQGSRIAGLALAYVQIESALPAESARARRIPRWLARRAKDGQAFIESRPDARSSSANHRYWNGLAAAAAGVAANDRALFEWGVESARIGLRQVDADGFLPLELARGKRARDYHIYAIAPLTLIAEIAAGDGIDLYRLNDGALRRLGAAAIAAIQDPAPMADAAGTPQLPFPGGAAAPPPHRLAWLEPFARRAPDLTAATDLLETARPTRYSALGGDLTLLFSAGLAGMQAR